MVGLQPNVVHVGSCICILTLEVTPRGGAESTTFQIAVFLYSYRLLGYSLCKLDLSAVVFLSYLIAFPFSRRWSRLTPTPEKSNIQRMRNPEANCIQHSKCMCL